MTVWMIRGKCGLIPYRHPKRCPKCKSDRIFAYEEDGHIVEHCDGCGFEQRYLVEEERAS